MVSPQALFLFIFSLCVSLSGRVRSPPMSMLVVGINFIIAGSILVSKYESVLISKSWSHGA